MTQHHNHEPVERGSDNIFADLGFPNPEAHLAKAGLAMQIIEIIRQPPPGSGGGCRHSRH
jgi:hypothetical protein